MPSAICIRLICENGFKLAKTAKKARSQKASRKPPPKAGNTGKTRGSRISEHKADKPKRSP